MLERMQIDLNDRCVWLFYNAIGAVAQCPYNWGVGSAFHRMKIHIQYEVQNSWIESFPFQVEKVKY